MGIRGSRRSRAEEFPWGDELTPGGQHLCNIWQGDFPERDTAEDGCSASAVECISAEPLRVPNHHRKCVGVVQRLVSPFVSRYNGQERTRWVLLKEPTR